jgi:hypothetical protein
MAVNFQSFDIDSTVEYATDHFDVTFIGSEPFRTKTKTDTVDISVGFLTGTGLPSTITFVDGGFVDEFEVEVDPFRIVGHKHGRDAIAFAMDSFFEKRYYRYPETIPVAVPEFDSTGVQTPTSFPNVPPAVVGNFFASKIARDAVESIGLTLNWGIPDYIVQKSFFASGRVIDTLKRLIRPFSTVAPFQADIISRGSTILIQQRKGVDVPVADFSISMKDMKRESMTARVRKTNRYRRVTLSGKPNNTDQSGTVFIEGELSLTRTDETFASSGALLSRTVTETKLSTPSNNMLTQVVTKYLPDSHNSLQMVSRQTTTNEWEAVLIGNIGPIGQKKLISSIVVSEGFDKNKHWVTLAQTDVGYSYDGDKFETGQTTVVKKLNQSKTPNVLEPNSQVIITKARIGTLLVETVTETYGYKKNTQNVLVPFLKSRVSDQQGGTPPGGPGRAQPQVRGLDAGAALFIVRTIDPDGFVDVTESFPDLPLRPEAGGANLLQIMDYYRKANYVWEYEVIFQGVNMPWIQRGIYLQITDVRSESDPSDPIVLPIMLVVDVETNYTEEKPEESKSMAKIRCLGWSQK